MFRLRTPLPQMVGHPSDNKMWKFVYESVDGTAHRERNVPCQDACRVQQFKHGDQSLAVVACADGAGSASHAEFGARIACDRFVEIVGESLRRDQFAEPSKEWAVECCSKLRDGLGHQAKQLDVPIRQVACTFLGAILEEGRASFLQIGDAAMVIRVERFGLAPVFWPASGEYVNTTFFLSDDEFADRLQFDSRAASVMEFAAFTDGLERLALSFGTRSAHEPFFARMFATLRASEDVGQLFKPLRQFLESELVNDRTDDDKTLILGTRLQGSSHGDETP